MLAKIASIVILSAFTFPTFSTAMGQDSSANELAREVIQHEVQAQEEDHSHWRYHQETKKDGKQEVKEVIETKDGSIERLVSINGRPLSTEGFLIHQGK